MKGVSGEDQLSFVQDVTIVPVVAQDLPVGSRLHQFREKWAALGNSPKVIHLPLPDPTKSGKDKDHQTWLCTFSQEQLPDRGITCIGQNSESLGFFN